MTAFEVAGRMLTLPVEVRRARAWAAHYLVPGGAARRLVAPAGLEAAEPFPGRAWVTLAFVRYEDGDLDDYNELAVTVAVRPHGAPPAGAAARAIEVARRRICAYVHRLPVDRAFSLEAGRAIWGYPKTLAEIEISERPGRAACTLRQDGALVLTLEVRTGGRIPLPQPAVPTYTFTGGVLRLTRWESAIEGRSASLGGASLTLGEHEIAAELRALGLPHRALAVTSARNVVARFSSAEVIR